MPPADAESKYLPAVSFYAVFTCNPGYIRWITFHMFCPSVVLDL